MKSSVLSAITVALVLSSLLGGCASPQFDYKSEAAKRIANKDWDRAYDLIEVALGSDNSATRLWGYDLLVANPSIKASAIKSFDKEAINRAFEIYDPITANDIQTYRLSLYEKYASDEEIRVAADNIRRAFDAANAPRLAILEAKRMSGSSLLVTDRVFDQLSSDDQAKLKLLYPKLRPIPGSGIGKVVSSQVLDKSRPGSTSGSQLGAAFGQAAYIDRSLPGRGYSAVGQFSAGLLGAVIGSSLNRSPEQRYLINYGIQLHDGTVKGVVSNSPDGVAAPIGQCVFVSDAQEAPGYLCSDNLVAFLERANSLILSGSGAHRSNKNGVKCKLPVVTLTLTVDECQRLNGEVIED